MAAITKIKKLETGKIQFLDSSDNIIVSLIPKAAIEGVGMDGLKITDSTKVKVYISTAKITSTQIDPDAAVPFAGTTQELWQLLANSFFTSSGAGAVSTDDVVNTSTVTGATATDALNTLNPDTRTVIKTMSDFTDNFPTAAGVITLPSGVYLIDSTNLDFTGFRFVITGNAAFQGYSQTVNKISNSTKIVTAFTIQNGASFNINELQVQVTGNTSKVFEMNGTGVEALELINCSFSNSTEWGTINNIRQIFISGFFATAGERGLLISTAISGIRLTNSLVLNMQDYIIKGDTGVTIGNIRSDINAVIPAGGVAFDFDYDMLSDNSYLLKDGFYNGDGQMVADFTTGDATAAEKSRRSLFNNNQGGLRKNTTIGGYWTVTAPAVTNIAVIDTLVKLAGTTAYRDLQHFTQTTDNAFVYSSTIPVFVEITGALTLEGNQDNTITVVVRHWDESKNKYTDIAATSKLIQRLQGARDIAEYSIFTRIELEENDRIELWVKNESGTANVTMEGDSRLLIDKLQ